jgi:hypothetical protein
MPLAEQERGLRRDHDGQRGQRTGVAQRSGEVARVVLVADRPAKSQHRAAQPGESTLEVAVDGMPELLDGLRRQRLARRDQARAFRPAPRFELIGMHRACYS